VRSIRRLFAGLRPGRSPYAPPEAAPTAAPAADGAVEYSPSPDGLADPGEVVWAWVPYEEDAARGKDRPVLVVGRRGGRWLGLMLTSKDHDRDAADEARWGRHWMDVGSGGWDRERRPSEVRLDRLLELDPTAVRREGAALERDVFDRVVAAARALDTLP
jgi:hypothetical protein